MSILVSLRSLASLVSLSFGLGHLIKKSELMTKEKQADDAFNKALTRESYEKFTHEYAKNTENLHPRAEAQKFVSMLPKNAKILDLGCGPGRDAKIFSQQGFQVVGIDFSPNMIALAKQNVPQGEFFVMDMEHFDFPKETFSGVWASASFLHIPKKSLPTIFKKILSTLDSGGIFYLSVKKGIGEQVLEDERYGNVKKFWSFFEENEIADYLTQAGFQIIDLATREKSSSYHTNPVIQIFCKKN